MNDCIRYQEKLHDWVDQELDLPTSEEIQLHLSQCPQCADAAKGIQHMKELVRSKAWKPEAPGSLRQGVTEMLAVESARQPQYRWSGRTILPLAATAALILVLLTPGFFDPEVSNYQLDAKVISEPVFNSHLQSMSGDDKPQSLFRSSAEASRYVSKLLNCAVLVPEFDNFNLWGVSVLEVGKHEIPKVFYKGADSHLSLFLVGLKYDSFSGIHTLRNGVKFAVYCYPGTNYCCVVATSDHPGQHLPVIGHCHCQVKNCFADCDCHQD